MKPLKRKEKNASEKSSAVVVFCKYLTSIVVRLEPAILGLTATRSVHRANRESDGQLIRKCIILKPILFVMFGNLKLVLRIYTSIYSICMSAVNI